MKIAVETISALRIFEGMSLNDMHGIVNSMTFNMAVPRAGKLVKRQGERCGEMLFLLKGGLKSIYTNDKLHFEFQEILTPNSLVEPYSLFGISPCYVRSYVSLGEVELVSIEKRVVLKLLDNYEVFRLNYLNCLCSHAFHLRNAYMPFNEGSASQKIIRLVASLAETTEGEKVMRIKKTALAKLLGESPRSVSMALHGLEEEGLVRLAREKITFSDAILKEAKY